LYPKAIRKAGKEAVGCGFLPERGGCSAVGLGGKPPQTSKSAVATPGRGPVTERIGKGDGRHGRLNESSFIIAVQECIISLQIFATQERT
jgi:hypothetical protein